MTAFNPNGGAYSHARVDRIERLITDAMVERALRRHIPGRNLAYYLASVTPETRAHTRRNLALGVSCGAVRIEEL